MPGPKLPQEMTARLLEDGWGPKKIADHYKRHLGIEVTPSAVSMFRKRYTDVPAKHKSEKVIPWDVRPEHKASVYRHAVLAWHQRERGEAVIGERYRNLMSIETRLKEAGRVIDYHPQRGWLIVPARPGVDLGVIREPDAVPRPATRGPYSLA